MGADKKEANQKLHRYLARFYAREPEKQGDESESLSLYALRARFLTWTETNLSESTREMYEHQLKTFVEKHGHRDAKEITPSDVENRKADIKRAGKKPRTINFFVQSIKRLYNWGVEQGLLDENPIEKVSRIPKDPPKDRSLDDEEVEVFLEYARESPPLGDFCEFLLLTGMRVGELRGMRWDDIDRKQKLVRIFEHKTAHQGEQRPRNIPLCSRALQIIDRQPHVSEFVFTGSRDQQLSYNALKCRKRRLEDKHDDMPHVTFHQFRHTCATRLAKAGVPERVAQEILGHSSKLMTRYYTQTSTKEMVDAVESIDTSTGS